MEKRKPTYYTSNVDVSNRVFFTGVELDLHARHEKFEKLFRGVRSLSGFL